MTDATSTHPISARPTQASSEDLARPAAIREAAVQHASKHGRLIRSAKDGRALSAMMLPFFLVRPPAGYGVLTYSSFALHSLRYHARRPPRLGCGTSARTRT